VAEASSTAVDEISESSVRFAEPIIPGFYPDPSVCRVGDDYFLAASSFEYFPGVPIFRSRDLHHWEQIGHALTRRTQFRLRGGGASRGIYAPTLRHHDGLFWLITTNVNDYTGGQVLVTATDPAGPWSEPVFIPGAVGIDPDLTWDDDGTCYLTWNALDFADGGRGIRQAPLDAVSGDLLEGDYPVWQGTGLQAPEGAHMYRIGQYWYQMLAEGGTERGHSVTIARGSSPRGPFEPCPWNPVFTHRSTSHPVQNVGHADLVPTPDGRWAAVYLGARPSGSTPGYHVNGRETFLAGVDWIDGWPVFDEARYAPSRVPTAFVDRFGGAWLDLRWVTPDSDLDAVTRFAGGIRTLLPRTDGLPALCTRVRDRRWTAEAEFGSGGVLTVWLDDRHWYGIRHADGTIRADMRIGDLQTTVAVVEVGPAPAVLRIRSVDPSTAPLPLGHGGPDDIVLSAVVGAQELVLARLDGRYLSTEVASGFTGRMLGLGAANGPSAIREFRYSPA
jgi:hypothetical protein